MLTAVRRFETSHGSAGYHSSENGPELGGCAMGGGPRAYEGRIHQFLSRLPSTTPPVGEFTPAILGAQERFVLLLAKELGVLGDSSPVTIAEYIRQGHSDSLVRKIIARVRSAQELHDGCTEAFRKTQAWRTPERGDFGVCFANVYHKLLELRDELRRQRSAADAVAERQVQETAQVRSELADLVRNRYPMLAGRISQRGDAACGALDQLARALTAHPSPQEDENPPILTRVFEEDTAFRSAIEALAGHFICTPTIGVSLKGWDNARDSQERMALMGDYEENWLIQTILESLTLQFSAPDFGSNLENAASLFEHNLSKSSVYRRRPQSGQARQPS